LYRTGEAWNTYPITHPADCTSYAIRYAIRRILRYAKYAAVGAIAAALGGTLLGTLGSGVAFFAAPGIGVGMAIGVITATAKVRTAFTIRTGLIMAVWMAA
jgi:hypothetical protein